MKQYIKTFGEIPEEVMVLGTKVFFDQDGIAVVNDEVAEVLDQVPGYSFVADVSKPTKVVKEPVEPSEAFEEEPVNEPTEHEGVSDPENVAEGTPIEEPAEDEEDEETSEEESPKPVKAPSRPRRPAPTKK